MASGGQWQQVVVVDPKLAAPRGAQASAGAFVSSTATQRRTRACGPAAHAACASCCRPGSRQAACGAQQRSNNKRQALPAAGGSGLATAGSAAPQSRRRAA